MIKPCIYRGPEAPSWWMLKAAFLMGRMSILKPCLCPSAQISGTQQTSSGAAPAQCRLWAL